MVSGAVAAFGFRQPGEPTKVVAKKGSQSTFPSNSLRKVEEHIGNGQNSFSLFFKQEMSNRLDYGLAASGQKQAKLEVDRPDVCCSGKLWLAQCVRCVQGSTRRGLTTGQESEEGVEHAL